MCSSSVKNNLKILLDELDKIKYIDIKKTLDLSNDVYYQCQKHNFSHGMCFSLLVKGNCLSFLGKYSDAIYNLSQAISIAVENNICDMQIAINISIGNIFADISNYEESFSFYNSAAKLCQKLSDSINYYSTSSYEIYYCKVCNNIGELYKVLGDVDSAFKLYKEAVDLDRQTDFKGTSGVSIANLGSVNLLKGNLDEAKIQILQGIEIANANNFPIAIPECYTNLAIISEREGNLELAERYFQNAINFSENSSGIFYKLDAIIYYSIFLRKQGNITSAIENLLNALKIAKANKLLEKCVNVCRELVNCYEALNDIKSSNKYYKLFFKYNDDLKSLTNNQILTSIKIKLKLDALENERQNLIKKNDAYRRNSEMLLASSKKMKILSELGQKITSTQKVDEIIKILSSNISKFMDVHNFSLNLYDRDKDCLVFNCSSFTDSGPVLPEIPLRDSKSLSAYCIRENELIIINDFDIDPLVNSELIDINAPDFNKNFKSAMYCPMLVDGLCLGIISVHSHVKNRFSALDIETMKALAAYAAIAINNSLKSSYLKIEIATKEKAQTDLEKVNKELKYLSEYDFLTKLSNRRRFSSKLLTEWQNCLKQQCSLSIIIFDVDYFKEYNDNYGHLMGDECLSIISSVFMECMDDKYIAARFGGDEFIALLPGVSEKEALKIGEKIVTGVRALKIEHAFSKVADIVTISLGVASTIPNNQNSVDELLKSADINMYKSKAHREKLFNSRKGL